LPPAAARIPGVHNRYSKSPKARRSRISATWFREPAMSDIDQRFTGSLPKIYETCLVPLIFEPYAADLQARVGSMNPSRILETAAGTGVVTRALAAVASPNASIVATDLSQPMLDEAAATGTARPVKWQRADAMALPFPDDEFDAVVCQFGVMFFLDKAKAFAEARRVLKPGGVLLFNVWDRISENEFADTVTNALVGVFPDDPPRFLARTPYGYHDVPTIQRDLAAGGFMSSVQLETVAARSRADSAHLPAFAYCQGTPLRMEIEARHASRLGEATDVAAAALAQQFGTNGVDGKVQAHVATIRK
jgi:SAM-dependent methyltransferase